MRIGFVTCVRIGLSCMEAIYRVGGELQLALTLRDELAAAKSGRVYLDDFCKAHGISLCKVSNINDPDALSSIRAAELDWLFIVGWSQIARCEVLSSTRKGVLGMHPTLLPIGRGRAPIPWAILLGLSETGVTLFKLDEGVDSGPIIAQGHIPIEARETATTLYAKVQAMHVKLLEDVWQSFIRGDLAPRTQDEVRATTWVGRKPEDGELNEDTPVDHADRLIRAVTHPYPGAFVRTASGLLRIWRTGAPGEDMQGDYPPGAVRRLQFRGGWLDAVEWTLEAS